MKLKSCLIGLFVCLLLFSFSCTQPAKQKIDGNLLQKDVVVQANHELNRNPLRMHYSKHARCRMDCRHIDETEVKDILANGTINYNKSELNNEACRRKYAVEGYAKNQHLRIIFAPCNNEVTVVTCIDLGNEWLCHCQGDH